MAVEDVETPLNPELEMSPGKLGTAQDQGPTQRRRYGKSRECTIVEVTKDWSTRNPLAPAKDVAWGQELAGRAECKLPTEGKVCFNRKKSKGSSILTMKGSDDVLRQMTWSPQSPDLNPIEMVWVPDFLRGFQLYDQPINKQLTEFKDEIIWKMENVSFIDGFVLLGLIRTPSLQKIFFGFFLIIYSMTVLGNLLIIFVIRSDSRLHKPMYYFLANLSVLEIFYTTTITPNTLRNFLTEDRSISFAGCFTQMFFFVALGGSECVLLSVMAYDRYIAICKPLLYSNYMNSSFCFKLVLLSYFVGSVNSLVHTVFASVLPYCKKHQVDHFFCDIPAVLKLSCRDTYPNELVSLLVGGFVVIGSLVLTLVSYICILRAVLNIQNMSQIPKAFSTCGSHLLVVTLYFGTIISTYMLPGYNTSTEQNRVLSVAYGIITPLMNPVIYSFRNADFLKAIRLAEQLDCLSLEVNVLRYEVQQQQWLQVANVGVSAEIKSNKLEL
ncbi:olfactory receptor 8I2-like [Ranitomeya imitator]|uniref:olfactory receptor 8I2-like n=1 Tax=Ranitomeya imitator TaxID=111125 RepID=UPI0037E7DE90